MNRRVRFDQPFVDGRIRCLPASTWRRMGPRFVGAHSVWCLSVGSTFSGWARTWLLREADDGPIGVVHARLFADCDEHLEQVELFEGPRSLLEAARRTRWANADDVDAAMLVGRIRSVKIVDRCVPSAHGWAVEALPWGSAIRRPVD